MSRTRTGIWAVVPIKELRLAKQRLAGGLPHDIRAGLARAMAADTLEALGRVRGLAGIEVVTADPDAARIARGSGASVCMEDARGGHTAVVAAAAARLAADGGAAILALPADIPSVTAQEIEALLPADLRSSAVTLVPSRGGDGTNAILAAPPAALRFAFGPGSFARHVAAARDIGIEPRIAHLPGIGLDIDTPEDLRLLMEHPADTLSRRYCLAHCGGSALLEAAR
jgi:2-phospho-L-lactate guanylyltransferase